MSLIHLASAAGLVAALAPSLSAQVFVDGTDRLPPDPINKFDTDQVDLADVDLDGDWDIGLANGRDSEPQQNQLWVNEGGLQGGRTGRFVDETAARLPVLADSSRDIEFGDIDGDGDEDIAIANAGFSPESNRIWVNQGLAQQGALGYYVDETASRYAGLGQPGSSVWPGQLLPAGGFADRSCAVAFADLDSDGDLDLVHSSMNTTSTDDAPTRLFLNDGTGVFAELNPSGIQLADEYLGEGHPALWAEGLQQDETTDATGLFADIALWCWDVEAADLDGDLDLDLVLSDRLVFSSTRFYRNRLAETGQVVFRDYTSAAMPASATISDGGVDIEFADLDGDLDLDVYGCAWGEAAGGVDGVFANQGDGAFGAGEDVPGTTGSDEEVDFIDFDHDGDLDVYIAIFGGVDQLVEDTGGGPAFGFVVVDEAESGLGFMDWPMHDAEVADLDGDGDDDIVTASGEANRPNRMAVNTTGTPDVTPPAIGATASGLGGVAAAGTVALRAQVYDNAPNYITRYADVSVRIEVEGVLLSESAMRWAGGQVFHSELPANLVGAIESSVVATDHAGNVGTSAPVHSVGTGWSATEFGSGCAGTAGVPSLQALSAPFGGTTLHVAGGNVPPGTPGALVLSAGQQAVPIDLGDGICSNVQSPFLWSVKDADASGHHLLSAPVPSGFSGATVYAQYFALAGLGGNAWASSAGLEITTP